MDRWTRCRRCRTKSPQRAAAGATGSPRGAITRRDALAAHLNKNGVQTAINYPTALPLVAAYQRLRHRPEQFPNAFTDQGRILLLPMFAEITRPQQDEVIRLVREF